MTRCGHERAEGALPIVTATRYVTPLREGGSLPGLVEADDDGMYVVKFTGAGQGTAALVAEVVVGELGRRLGVRVPELVGVELDPAIGLREPDQEVQELLKASSGLNLGMDFLPGSVGYDGVAWRPDPLDAARVFWLDALHRQRRPDLAQPQPARLAPHPVGHRPRRRRWCSSTRGRRPRRGPAAATTSRSTCCCPSSASCADAELSALDAELAAAVPELLPEVLDLVPAAWLTGMNAAQGDPRGARRVAGALRRAAAGAGRRRAAVADARGRGVTGVPEGWCPSTWCRSTTRYSTRCRGSTAASA